MYTTIEDIKKVYMIDYYNEEYISNFENSFNALYEFSKYVKEKMGKLRILRLIPFVFINERGDKIATLKVSISDNEFKTVDNESEIFFKCTKWFFGEYDLDITKDIFIELDCHKF